ncbi:MAG TPA: 16S rRNA (guanine(966)-N(2))-methyltransferase RsmD [Jatrophihabitans sp.]|nr:16S rRNA (guanine(966)-N(2))-methyltransferase RsmD [Jatrophihabitans sp.]
MRIVAGSAKGRRLVAPAAGTRPTSDRAREALFNSLAASIDLDGARVLDLYAGTGAVGLEALSRGAAQAVFVENGRTALEALRRNVDAVALPGTHVVPRPVAGYVAGPAPEQPFTLVFADPPYELGDDQLADVLAALAGPGWLAPDAYVVVERAARGAPPRWPAPFVTPVRERRYGAGVLWYGRRR